VSEPLTVYVLWWKWSDGSAADVSRVYLDGNRAVADCELLNGEESRVWTVNAVVVQP